MTRSWGSNGYAIWRWLWHWLGVVFDARVTFRTRPLREGEDEAAHHEPFSGNATPQRFLRS